MGDRSGLRIGGRRSLRLAGFDYASNGAYFITICTYERVSLFGEVDAGRMSLNDLGHIVDSCWSTIPDHFPHVTLDEWIVMPNHIANNPSEWPRDPDNVGESGRGAREDLR